MQEIEAADLPPQRVAIGGDQYSRRSRRDGKYQTFTPSMSTGRPSGTALSPGPSTLVVNTCTSWPRAASAAQRPCTEWMGPP